MTARLGILLSGSGTTYQNLADWIAAGRLPATIACVIGSREDLGGLQKAVANGHPTVVARSPAAVSAALAEHEADYVAMCGWLKFWDPPARWAGRVVNIHPSLLPSFGGQGMYGERVHRAVLAHGCRVSGCTAHLVSGDYDSGPILAQRAVPVFDGDDAGSLQARVQAAERDLFPLVVRALVGGTIRQLPDGRYTAHLDEEI